MFKNDISRNAARAVLITLLIQMAFYAKAQYQTTKERTFT